MNSRVTILSHLGRKTERMTGRVGRVIIIALANNMGKNESIIHRCVTWPWLTDAVGFRSIYVPHTTPSRQSMRAHSPTKPGSSRKQLSNISVEDNRSPYRSKCERHEYVCILLELRYAFGEKTLQLKVSVPHPRETLSRTIQ